MCRHQARDNVKFINVLPQHESMNQFIHLVGLMEVVEVSGRLPIESLQGNYPEKREVPQTTATGAVAYPNG